MELPHPPPPNTMYNGILIWKNMLSFLFLYLSNKTYYTSILALFLWYDFSV